MREAMVDSQLRTSDVGSPRVIQAMSEVPREAFVPEEQRAFAYADRGVSVGGGRRLNTPLATGRLIDAVNLTAADNVLLIGAATGYTAAVVARLAGHVVAVEQDAALVERARVALGGVPNIALHHGPHADGCPERAPYTALMIDGYAEQLPDALTDQLAEGGRVVGALADGAMPRLALGIKAGGVVGYRYFADYGSVAIPGLERPRGFTF